MSEAEAKAELDMDYLIGMALRYGVILSVALLIIGIALLARDGAGAGEVLGAGSPLNTSVIQVPAILSGIPSLNPLSFIVLGLVVLIATPVLRVVLGIISFARERDRLYVFITSIVLMNLLLAIFLIPMIVHL
ncbi:DUF1634 domain-containing protein [Conexivisphaera calida]|uniref:TVG1210382 protein n=1 Tax=Conexivisphaera calida TaxID=1874277 RepID=A0A4P2VEA7_9ARCH|nr:DUF1634 domain-containing protein [Conexivisphaera calida]BBE42172.1 TVG1210382 protein [Conexivisphaera calida]